MDIQKTIDAKLVLLERRSKELLEDIRALKEQRNTHAKVSRLPDEVLLEIFMVLMAKLPAGKWYPVALVCRRWRDVAVEAPMLWTKPPTDNHFLASLALSRSKMMDLTVFVGSNTSLPAAEAVLEWMERIESLTIEVPYDENLETDDAERKYEEILDIIMESLRVGTPRLKTVHIRNSPKISFDFPDCEMILRLLQSSDTLQKLHLDDIQVDCSFLPIRTLSHLYLEDMRITPRITIQQLVDILGQMPLLESLTLPLSRYVLDDSSPEPGKSEGKITLPCLRNLNLPGSNHHVLYFLEHTTFPRLRCLDLKLELSSPSEHSSSRHIDFLDRNYSDILEKIVYIITSSDFGIFDGIAIGTDHFCLFMSGTPYRMGDTLYPLASPHIRFSFDRITEKDKGARICTMFAIDISSRCQVNCPGFLQLHIDGPTELEMMQLLGKPPYLSLQTITVACGTSFMTSFITILVPHDSLVIPFPHLKAISFWSWDSAASESTIEALCNCMLLRRQHGSPLHQLTLRLEDYALTSSQQTRLEQAVVNLAIRPLHDPWISMPEVSRIY